MGKIALNKVLSLIVLVTFLFNDICFGLGTQPGTTQSATKEEMYALGQKRFAAKIGPGGIDFDEYLNSGGFAGELLLRGPIGAPYIDDYKTTFVTANYENFPESLPHGWKNNRILLEQTNLIKALEMFRDTEARISSDKLEIKEGWFPINEGEGELPIAQIVPMPDGKYVLVVHTAFVQMWNHIRENDVWFEVDSAPGNRRTVSVAWGLFYRLAKHEMAELSSRDGTFKSLGHIIYNIDKAQSDEGLANEIGGNYALFNDAIWMWFLGSYCFRDTTRYNNPIFLDRITWFFEDKDAQKLNLHMEFPNLLKSPDKRRMAMAFAYTINYSFFNRSGIRVPGTDSLDSGLMQKYYREYGERQVARGIANITEAPIFATGRSTGQEPTPIMPARIQYDHGNKKILITLQGGISDGVYAVVDLSTGKAMVYAREGGPVLQEGPIWDEAAGLIKKAVDQKIRELKALKRQRDVRWTSARQISANAKRPISRQNPITDDEVLEVLSIPQDDDELSLEPSAGAEPAADSGDDSDMLMLREEDEGESPVAGMRSRVAKLTDLADHAIVNALIKSIIEYSGSKKGRRDGDSSIYYDQNKRVFWLGSKFSANKSFADLFDKLVNVYATRYHIKNIVKARLKVAKNLVKEAGLEIEVDNSYVDRLRSRLALQLDHFGVERERAYIMRAYKLQPYASVVMRHIKIEMQLHHEIIKHMFKRDKSFDSYREWRKGKSKIHLYETVVLRLGKVEIELPTHPMTYREFIQWAHEEAEKASPVSGLIKQSSDDIETHLKIARSGEDQPALEPPTAGVRGSVDEEASQAKGKDLAAVREEIVTVVSGQGLTADQRFDIVYAILQENKYPYLTHQLRRMQKFVGETAMSSIIIDRIKSPEEANTVEEQELLLLAFFEPNKMSAISLTDSVRDLDFAHGLRAIDVLERRRIKTVEQVTQLTRRELLKFEGIHKALVDDIEDTLERHGFGLADSKARDFIGIINTYMVQLGLYKGPGAEVLPQEDAENIYRTVALLKDSQIEILIPQGLRLTEAMTKAIRSIGKREGRTPVVCRQYNCLKTLDRILKSPAKGKRIVITNISDDDNDPERIKMVQLVKENPELFKNIRLLNVATPKNYSKMDSVERTVYQAKIITIAILSRLFEKNKTPMVESLLRTMMRGCLETKDLDAFLDELGKPEDGAGLPRDALVQRILFLLGKTVRVVEKIGEEIRLMKNFWIAA